jgi:hypothetical protein
LLICGGVALLPVGQQFVEAARLQHGAGQDVRADLRALLDQADRHLPAGLRGELLEADGAGEPGGSAADDDHVILHSLPLHTTGRALRPLRRRS